LIVRGDAKSVPHKVGIASAAEQLPILKKAKFSTDVTDGTDSNDERKQKYFLSSQLRKENPPTNFADIGNIEAIPYLSSGCRQQYKTWLSWSEPRAFGINAKGHCSFTTGTRPPEQGLPEDPVERALLVCEKKFGGCAIYAIDDQVVWKN
jgi:hypothetical protein